MPFCSDNELQEKIKQRRAQGISISQIAKEFPEYSFVTYKRFLRGTGRVRPNKENLSASCKKAWENITSEKKEKHIEHLRKLAAEQKGKPFYISEEHLQNMRSWLSSKKNSERVSSQNKRIKKKYTVNVIEQIAKNNNVHLVGDLRDTDNVIDVFFADGTKRRGQIKKFMKDGFSPLIGQNRKKELAIARRQRIGLDVQEAENGNAVFTYKEYSWIGQWKNALTATLFRKIKKIDQALMVKNKVAEGVSFNKACKEAGINSTTFYRHYKKTLNIIEAVLSIREYEKLLNIDKLVSAAIYNNRLPNYKIRPDIRVEFPVRLIIETDGVRYHTEEYRPKGYHYKKAEIYLKEGYAFLSFTQWEIDNKKAIVMSMIKNKLKLITNKFHARKGVVTLLDNEASNTFFTENHLMGKGQGKTLALTFDNQVICAIRFYLLKNQIHISRFCNKCECTVIGAYSKLIKELSKLELDIVNFVDKRHGTGEHLLQYGFVKEKEHIGFFWADTNELYNRRKFLGNTGYDFGLKKYYDYGQIKYVKHAKL